MIVDFYEHQKKVIPRIKNGTILKGGTGSGKSRTGLAWYYYTVCKGGSVSKGTSPMFNPKNLIIITTAEKRNKKEWDEELLVYNLYVGKIAHEPITIQVDSWQNIKKYTGIKNSVFLFDEQNASGNGVWAKAMIHIARFNEWIMLSATPGDKWSDYAAVFIANGFYKNFTDFENQHVVLNPWVNYKSVLKYIECDKLLRLKHKVVIRMSYSRKAFKSVKYISVPYDETKLNTILKDLWNPYTNEPIKNASEKTIKARQAVNENINRVKEVYKLFLKHDKIIVFYNFNYELNMLKEMLEENGIVYGELNGKRHDPIPSNKTWVYLVQYIAGREAWNCIQTDTTVIFSLNHSYRMTRQAEGRIDRANTPYKKLYYYYIITNSFVDNRILKCLSNKKDFNSL